MDALKELFTTPVGLLSLAVIVGVIVMGFWFSNFFRRQIEREEAQRRR